MWKYTILSLTLSEMKVKFFWNKDSMPVSLRFSQWFSYGSVMWKFKIKLFCKPRKGLPKLLGREGTLVLEQHSLRLQSL